MAADYWETTVYVEEPLVSLERSDGEDVFSWMSATLPMRGTKIDWRAMAEGHQHWRMPADPRAARALIAELASIVGAEGSATHVGDSLSPYGLRFETGVLPTVLSALLEIGTAA